MNEKNSDINRTVSVEPGRVVSYQELLSVEAGEIGEPLVSLNEHIACAYMWFDMLPITGETVYVRSSVASKLVAVQEKLQQIQPEYSLKVFYGYRHPKIQKKYFENVKEELKYRYPEKTGVDLEAIVHNYIAVPQVAGHPTGGAVDVTITSRDGDIPMGSGVEDFSDNEKMHTFSSTVGETARKNRILLHDLMMEQEFAPFYGEWWHFSYGDKEWAYFYGKKESLYSPVDFSTRRSEIAKVDNK
jgi:D-alanyl-D-alanine dipeptidase